MNRIRRYENFLRLITIHDLAKSRSRFKNFFRGVIREERIVEKVINFNIPPVDN